MKKINKKELLKVIHSYQLLIERTTSKYLVVSHPFWNDTIQHLRHWAPYVKDGYSIRFHFETTLLCEINFLLDENEEYLTGIYMYNFRRNFIVNLKDGDSEDSFISKILCDIEAFEKSFNNIKIRSCMY